jgi:hypothetical protein
LPNYDPFVSFARTGIPIAPDSVAKMAQDPPGITMSIEGPSRTDRVRAWRLTLPFSEVEATLKTTMQGGGGGSGSSSRDGKLDFEAEYRRYYDSETGAQALLLRGTKVPQGSRCVLLVEEPQGMQAGWQRLVARLKRGFTR